MKTLLFPLAWRESINGIMFGNGKQAVRCQRRNILPFLQLRHYKPRAERRQSISSFEALIGKIFTICAFSA